MWLSRFLGLALTADQERLVWLAGSVLLYVSATNLAWAIRRVVRRVSWAPTASVLTGIARFAYYVGMPYVALLGGVVTLSALGLVPAPSRRSFSQGALLAVGAVILVGIIGWYYRRRVFTLQEAEGSRFLTTKQIVGRSRDWFAVLVILVFQQAHWAFYRALSSLTLDDRYAGSFIGLGLVLLEAYADPRVRRDLTKPDRMGFLLLSATFAVVTTVLFVLTGTSWLGAGAHLAAVVGWISFVQVRNHFRLSR